MIARRAIAGRGAARPPVAGGFRMGNAIRMAGRVLGAAAIIGEVIIAAGQVVRRTELGFSGRLIDAQDAHTFALTTPVDHSEVSCGMAIRLYICARRVFEVATITR